MSKKKGRIEAGDLLISTTDTRNRKIGDFLLICYIAPPVIGYEYAKTKFAEANKLTLAKETEFASPQQKQLFLRGQLNTQNV